MRIVRGTICETEIEVGVCFNTEFTKGTEKRWRLLLGGGYATAGFFEGDGFDFAGNDVSHAALNFFVPRGFNGGIVGFIEAFYRGTGEVSAYRDGEGKSLFRKFGGFLGLALMVTGNMFICGVTHPL